MDQDRHRILSKILSAVVFMNHTMGNHHLTISRSCKRPARVLSLNNSSRAIAKSSSDEKKITKSDSVSMPPIIRIVKIFSNPVFVKTDAMHFPTLVQKLTGNSSCGSRSAAVDRPEEMDYGSYGSTESNSVVESEPVSNLYSWRAASGNDSGASRAGLCRRKSSCCFSDLDIWAGLASDQSLPDITMLPPLAGNTTEFFQELQI